MPASLRSDPGRLTPEHVADFLPDWVAEITGIRTMSALLSVLVLLSALFEAWEG